MRARQDLVAGRKGKRAQHRVHPGGRVFDEDKVLRARADEARKRGGRFPQRPGQGFAEKNIGIRLQTTSPALGELEDGPRRRAKGAVVEKIGSCLEAELRS